MIVSVSVTVSVVFFSTLAGFAFAKLRFRGRNALLLVIIATMMVPTQLGIIPLYMLMVKLGWIERPARRSSCPFLVTGFGVFMMRQYAAPGGPGRADRGGPGGRLLHAADLLERRAARAAAGRRRCSACSPSWSTWNDFLWPYVGAQRRTTRPCSCRSATLSSGYYTDYVAGLRRHRARRRCRCSLVFVVFGRQIIGGIMEGAVKA